MAGPSVQTPNAAGPTPGLTAQVVGSFIAPPVLSRGHRQAFVGQSLTAWAVDAYPPSSPRASGSGSAARPASPPIDVLVLINVLLLKKTTEFICRCMAPSLGPRPRTGPERLRGRVRPRAMMRGGAGRRHAYRVFPL